MAVGRRPARAALAALALAGLAGCEEPPTDGQARVALAIRLLSSGSGYSQAERAAVDRAKIVACVGEGAGVWRCELGGGKRARFAKSDSGWVALPD